MRAELRTKMRDYCEQDTWVMVRLAEYLEGA